MAIVEQQARVKNRLGLHARPAAAFVKLANRFRCESSVAKDGMVVNGKSIMGVMTLAAECGSELTIRADGDDAETAVDSLAALVQRQFETADDV